MLVIVLAVVLSGVLPGMPLFQNAAGDVLGIHIFGSVSLSYPTLIEIAMILAAAFLSFKTTKKDVRTKNNFTWGAIEEVAMLFIGIFYHHDPGAAVPQGARCGSGPDRALADVLIPAHCPPSGTIRPLIWCS